MGAHRPRRHPPKDRRAACRWPRSPCGCGCTSRAPQQIRALGHEHPVLSRGRCDRRGARRADRGGERTGAVTPTPTAYSVAPGLELASVMAMVSLAWISEAPRKRSWVGPPYQNDAIALTSAPAYGDTGERPTVLNKFEATRSSASGQIAQTLRAASSRAGCIPTTRSRRRGTLRRDGGEGQRRVRSRPSIGALVPVDHAIRALGGHESPVVSASSRRSLWCFASP